MSVKYFLRILYFALLLFAVAPKTAYAYLDPGTGSILIQGALAILFGGLFYIRTIYSNVKGFFSQRIFKRHSSDFDAPDDDE